VWSGRYTNFIRGNTLAYTWQAPGDEYETTVLIKLIPQAGGTLLEMTHSGFTSNAALDKAIRGLAPLSRQSPLRHRAGR
jgi:uncharacterized protein YndB with AHSA1/START domain